MKLMLIAASACILVGLSACKSNDYGTNVNEPSGAQMTNAPAPPEPETRAIPRDHWQRPFPGTDPIDRPMGY